MCTTVGEGIMWGRESGGHPTKNQLEGRSR